MAEPTTPEQIVEMAEGGATTTELIDAFERLPDGAALTPELRTLMAELARRDRKYLSAVRGQRADGERNVRIVCMVLDLLWDNHSLREACRKAGEQYGVNWSTVYREILPKDPDVAEMDVKLQRVDPDESIRAYEEECRRAKDKGVG